MSDDPQPTPRGNDEAGTEPQEAEHDRQEAGAREQGVLTEHSSDLSSPQLTEPAEERDDRSDR